MVQMLETLNFEQIKKSNVKFLDNVEIEHNSVEKTTTVKVFMQGNAKD